MKRMILVPEDAYARFEQKQKLETSPIMKNIINTDTDMTDILQCTDVDDTEKQKLYYANLERYLNLRQQKDSQTPTVQIAPSATSREEPPPPQTMHNYLTQSLSSIYPKPCVPELQLF